MKDAPHFDPNPKPGDRLAKTTCYMCACRCGIDVHLKTAPGGTEQIAYIEGNRDHPVNRGVLCAKGAAGILNQTSPARLRAPLLRTGPRGSGQMEEISWDRAMEILTDRLGHIRRTAPEKLAFFTGRDQSQSLTGYWAQQFGTPNYAAHGGFCSVNMAAAGIYTMGGSFWEFGQPDWERTELFLLFGCAEDHDSNPMKLGLSRLKARGVPTVGINPIRTGYNAVADDWLGITPGTDGLLILSLVHCLLKAGRIDLDYLTQFTNAGALVDGDPHSKTHGLLMRDEAGRILCIDRATGKRAPIDTAQRPDLAARWRRAGTTHRAVFQHIADRYLSTDYAPETVAPKCGLTPAQITALAAKIAEAAFDKSFDLPIPWTDHRGRRHETVTARPVSMHAMRGISAHSNGFQTARALHLLQILIGAVERPGGFRFKPPYPKSAASHARPHATATPGTPLGGPPLGYPLGPEDLAVAIDGTPLRIDKAFSWETPLSPHGLMHMVISNAHAGDPYEIDTLFLYMANMAWNSSMNTKGVMEMLSDTNETGDYRIPFVVVADAYSSETVAFADLVLPDTTYLERHDCISLLDRPISEADAAADAIRHPVLAPDRDVRCFQSVLIDLGARLNLPGFAADDGTPLYEDYADYIQYHERRPGVGPLAGWRMGDTGLTHGRGAPNGGQIASYIANGGFWRTEIPEGASYMRPWNAAYQDWAVRTGLQDAPAPYLFELWSEPLRRFQMAAEGKGPRRPPASLAPRMAITFDPLPIWYAPLQDGHADPEAYPFHALTQRPAAMYHSWGGQNPWLRQIHGMAPLFLPTAHWHAEGFADGDWARVTSPHGEMTVPVAHMAALNPHTVWTWNAIAKRRGAWALSEDAPEATKGFLLNHLIHELLPPKGDGLRWSNSDPVTGQAAWFDLRVAIERVPASDVSHPDIPAQESPVPKGQGDLRRSTGRPEAPAQGLRGLLAKLLGQTAE